jgi:hypothetical protein
MKEDYDLKTWNAAIEVSADLVAEAKAAGLDPEKCIRSLIVKRGPVLLGGSNGAAGRMGVTER